MEFVSPKIPRSERRNCTVISTDTPASKALRKDIKNHSLEFQLVLNIQHPTEIYVVLPFPAADFSSWSVWKQGTGYLRYLWFNYSVDPNGKA